MVGGGVEGERDVAGYAACEPIVTTNVFPRRNGTQNKAHMTCSENTVFTLRCIRTSLNTVFTFGLGAGAGARGLAKRIQFATGYVPALASGLLGRSANQTTPYMSETQLHHSLKMRLLAMSSSVMQ